MTNRGNLAWKTFRVLLAGAVWFCASGTAVTEEVSSPAANVSNAGEVARAGTHWAFVPPKEPVLPSIRQTEWPLTPVDQFILAELEARKLSPAAPADKRTLLRRATYDLTGLPPTMNEVTVFLGDASPLAFQRVVDRLLASPRYGERWGRHWLDVARYADTKGYVYDREEKRFVHAHAYRDWVIRSFNHDRPYDRFLALQLAADGMTSATGPERDDLAAMGFLTVGRRFLGVVHDIIDDRIDVVSRGMLGLTVSCARCHDHKFDPVPTRDYYSLYGVFANSSEKTVPLDTWEANPTDRDKFLKGLHEREEKLQTTFEKKCEELSARLRARTTDYLAAVLKVTELPSEEFYAIMGPDDLNPVVVRRWESRLYKATQRNEPVFRVWHAFAALPGNDFPTRAPQTLNQLSGDAAGGLINNLVWQSFSNRPPASMLDVAQRYGAVFAQVETNWQKIVAEAARTKTPVPTGLDENQEPIREVLYGAESPARVPAGAMIDVEWFFDENTRVELTKLQAEIDRWLIKTPGARPHAVILEDRAEPRNPRVFIRGNPATKGDEVPLQFLQVIAGPSRQPFRHGSGRLELAHAVASAENPLTARVMVNRVWQHHFGNGLVRTASDFGLRSEMPSHPALLDWLALRFVESGWSVKHLHRLIMLSRVYQQSSLDLDAEEPAAATAAAGSASRSSSLTVDPENRYLSRMNRARLDLEGLRDSLMAVSGELDLAMGGKPTELFGGSPSPRRAVYGFVDRQFVPTTLRMFDFANPDMHSPTRPETTVPQQSLFFMNGSFLIERAKALAARDDIAACSDPAARVRALYERVYQRGPSAREIASSLAFIRDLEAHPINPVVEPPSAWQYGYGYFDAASGSLTNFEKLPHFTGDAWQGGSKWPDSKLGWVQLTAEGGHAGNDQEHAAVRRWTAPVDGVVDIGGLIAHAPEAGDGIRAYVVSSSKGLLKSWTVHHQSVPGEVLGVNVKQNETIDFIVDRRDDLNSDMFAWAPIIRVSGPSAAKMWEAKTEFRGPSPDAMTPLGPWEKYAQVLLQANEFVFVD